MKEDFVDAIREKRKVRITFFSKDDNAIISRKCAPMDYGPSRRAKAQNDRFHLWDYESDKTNHTLSLNPEQMREIDVLEETFDPSEFITWDRTGKPWFIERDWGEYS